MATFILLLKKATDKIAKVPQPGGSKQLNETFSLSSASTFLSSILIYLVTDQLSPRRDDDLRISQHYLLHFHKDPLLKNVAVPGLKI